MSEIVRASMRVVATLGESPEISMAGQDNPVAPTLKQYLPGH